MWDKFDPKNSHMIPAVIRKLEIAKSSNKTAEIWGDGSARREFMYAEDLADFILFSLVNYKSLDQYTNVGLGFDYSILDYANRIMKILNINLKIKYINKQLSGTPRKLLDCTLAKKLGWKSKISLDKGLTETVEDFCKNYKKYA